MLYSPIRIRIRILNSTAQCYKMRFSKVILVWDNDGQDLREDVILKRTVTSLTRAGKEVWLLVPPLLPQAHKTDLNDVLQSGGCSAVERVLRDCVHKCKLDIS